MKKIISLLTVCLMVLSMAACDASKAGNVTENPYETYKAAIEKVSGADSMHVNMDMLLSMSYDMGGVNGNMDMNIGMEMKAAMKDNAVDEAEYKMSMEFATQKMEVNAYMADGFVYAESDGQKTKEAIETADSNLIGMEDLSGDILGDLKDAIISEEAKKDGSDTVITLKIDGTKVVGGFVEGFMEGMGESLGEMDLKEIVVTAKIDKDDTIKSVSLEFPLDVSSSGMEMEASCKIDMEYVQIGGVEITAPADLDSYN